MKISNMKIGTRLLIGFGLVIFFALVLGAVAINRMQVLSNLTEKMYLHPLTVSNAAKDVNANIIAMHRSMKDVTLAKTSEEIEAASRTIDRYEKEVYQGLEIIEERFLGDQSDVKALATLFTNWKPFRDEVIAFMHSGNMDEAVEITKGKGAVHIKLLENKIATLIDFAHEKGNSFFESAQKTRFWAERVMYILLGLVVVIGVGIATFITASIDRGLGELTQVAEAVKNGDLTVRSKNTNTDEIGQLSIVFNSMTENLYKLVSQVQKGALQVSSASEQLSSSSQLMSTNSEEAERQTVTVSSISEETNLSIQSVSTASEEMSVTIKEISKSVQEATLITSDAVKMAESTNITISKLGDSSAEIGNVSKVITSIAQQTNLLALNATIEAARAGEAGKGFAVVANEVKDLAKATAKATEEIGQKISAIQEDTQSAVSAIEEIGTVIKKINDISTNIAGAIEEQAATTNEITRSVAEVASGTNKVAQSITGVAEASKSTAEVATNVMMASQGLSSMGMELLSMVNKFDVNTNLNENSALSETIAQEASQSDPAYSVS